MQQNRKLKSKKRVKRKEAELMGFKLLINNQGQFITEIKTYPKDKVNLHYHKNSYLSGVFYINTLKDDNIVLVDSQPKYCLEIESEYLTDQWNLPVKHGQLILFPSFLYHEVEKNRERETRVSLSFNTFIKGDINNCNAAKIKL